LGGALVRGGRGCLERRRSTVQVIARVLLSDYPWAEVKGYL